MNTEDRVIEVTLFYFMNKTEALKLAIPIQSTSKCDQIRKQLAKLSHSYNPNNFIISIVFMNKTEIWNFIDDDFPISEIRDDDDIFAFHIPRIVSTDYYLHRKPYFRSEQVLPFLAITMKTTKTVQDEWFGLTWTSLVSFGHPFIVKYNPAKTTMKQVYDECVMYLRRYFKDDLREFFRNYGSSLFINPSLFFSCKCTDSMEVSDTMALFFDSTKYKWGKILINEAFTYSDELVETKRRTSIEVDTICHLILYINPKVVNLLLDEKKMRNFTTDNHYKKSMREKLLNMCFYDSIITFEE